MSRNQGVSPAAGNQAAGKAASTPITSDASSNQAGAAAPRGAVARALREAAERVGKRIGTVQIPKLINQRQRVQRELRAIPERMQKVTNQASLVLDLIDDYRDGSYRAISWLSLAIAGGALLYSVSPSDVVPDFLPVLGQLDDAIVIASAMRLIRRDLQRYCEFKGYDPAKYF